MYIIIINVQIENLKQLTTVTFGVCIVMLVAPPVAVPSSGMTSWKRRELTVF